MNKNISFFLILAIFNFTFTEEETVATETVQEEIAVVETDNVISRSHNLKITIEAKNASDTTLFDEKAQALLEMIQSAHRTQDGSNLYLQILAFIKETQEAIAAGLNLFSSATNSNSVQIINAIEEVVTAKTPVISPDETTEVISNEATTEIVSNEETATQDSATVESTTTEIASEETRSVVTTNRNIEINISISLEKQEDENLFNAIVVKMNDLTQIINSNSNSGEDIVNILNDIILASHHLQNTNLTIKIN